MRQTIVLTGTLALVIPATVTVTDGSTEDPVARLQKVHTIVQSGDRPELIPRGRATLEILLAQDHNKVDRNPP